MDRKILPGAVDPVTSHGDVRYGGQCHLVAVPEPEGVPFPVSVYFAELTVHINRLGYRFHDCNAFSPSVTLRALVLL